MIIDVVLLQSLERAKAIHMQAVMASRTAGRFAAALCGSFSPAERSSFSLKMRPADRGRLRGKGRNRSAYQAKYNGGKD